MTDDIRPALTPEEWGKSCAEVAVLREATVVASRDAYEARQVENLGELEYCSPPYVVIKDRTEYSYWYVSRPRALAALCLHGHPQGFTRDTVRILRAACSPSDDDAMREIAKIEALLPPE